MNNCKRFSWCKVNEFLVPRLCSYLRTYLVCTHLVCRFQDLHPLYNLLTFCGICGSMVPCTKAHVPCPLLMSCRAAQPTTSESPTLGICWQTPSRRASPGTRLLGTKKATGGPLCYRVLWSAISRLAKCRWKCSWSQLLPLGLSTLHKMKASGRRRFCATISVTAWKGWNETNNAYEEHI